MSEDVAETSRRTLHFTKTIKIKSIRVLVCRLQQANGSDGSARAGTGLQVELAPAPLAASGSGDMRGFSRKRAPHRAESPLLNILVHYTASLYVP